jgi:hypothetical protein
MVWTTAARQALCFLDQIEPYCVGERMKERIMTARWWQELKATPWQKRGDEHDHDTFACAMWMSELNSKGVRQ